MGEESRDFPWLPRGGRWASVQAGFGRSFLEGWGGCRLHTSASVGVSGQIWLTRCHYSCCQHCGAQLAGFSNAVHCSGHHLIP